MPIDKYYGGHGSEVMSNMKKEYGGKKGESVFYATANKRKQKPAEGSPSEEASESPRQEAAEKAKGASRAYPSMNSAHKPFPAKAAPYAAPLMGKTPPRKQSIDPLIGGDAAKDGPEFQHNPTPRKKRGFKSFGEAHQPPQFPD